MTAAPVAPSSTAACTPYPVETYVAPQPPVSGATDTQPPTVPGKPEIAICAGLLTVRWAPSTDNVGVASYVVRRIIGDVIYTFSVRQAGWSTATWYSYEQIWVMAVDRAGNRSAGSEVATFGTRPSCPPPMLCTSGPPTTGVVTTGPDTQAPSAPGKPVVSVVDGVATVSWAASTDNVGVVSYQVHHMWTDVIELVTVAAPATSRQFNIGTSGIQHSFWVTAKDAAGNTSPSSPTTSIGTPSSCAPMVPCSSGPPSSAPPGVACAVQFTVVNAWPGGYQADIRIRNTGSVPIDPWTLEFSLSGGISQVWNATVTQSGTSLSLAALSWNRLIPPGGSVTIGFLGTGTPVTPTQFKVNGTVCANG
ncbi:cellulose binding domain-containing protein [Luedemannella helvata]|uniref:cellulose binding domain-containing protein n=1 Tax=Luedemannella helvata TaxID=349315 RepID=UPI0031DFCE57